MTREEFMEHFGDKIALTAFMPQVFLTHPGVNIQTVEKEPSEILQFYVPLYQKDGKNFVFEKFVAEVLPDPEAKPVQVSEVLNNLAAWDLVVESLPNENELLPVPIATDKSTGKTLILDSNHTLCGLLASGQLAKPVKFVEATLEYPEAVFLDFIPIKR